MANGDTENIGALIEDGNFRASKRMQDAEIRLQKLACESANPCRIGEPLLEVFRSGREGTEQIMANQLFMLKYIAKNNKNNGNGNGNGNSNGNGNKTGHDFASEENRSRPKKVIEFFKGLIRLENYNLMNVAVIIILLYLLFSHVGWISVKSNPTQTSVSTNMLMTANGRYFIGH
jgi:hypothetical protein